VAGSAKALDGVHDLTELRADLTPSPKRGNWTYRSFQNEDPLEDGVVFRSERNHGPIHCSGWGFASDK
jgi:hypothetical protein